MWKHHKTSGEEKSRVLLFYPYAMQIMSISIETMQYVGYMTFANDNRSFLTPHSHFSSRALNQPPHPPQSRQKVGGRLPPRNHLPAGKRSTQLQRQLRNPEERANHPPLTNRLVDIRIPDPVHNSSDAPYKAKASAHSLFVFSNIDNKYR